MNRRYLLMLSTLFLAGSMFISFIPAPAHSEGAVMDNETRQRLSEEYGLDDPGPSKPHDDTDIGMVFSGEGNARFTYSGRQSIWFKLQNNGAKRVHVRLDFPNGSNLARFEVNSQEDFSLKLPLHEVYGTSSLGHYSVYLYNDDGSKGSAAISVQSIY